MKMDKIAVRGHIIANQQAIIEGIKSRINDYEALADLDENETKDMEDFSQQNQSDELKRRLMEQLQRAESDLNYFKSLPVDTKGAVILGALVVTEGRSFYIGVATDPIAYEDTQVIGISTEAPIMQLLENKLVGDSIELGAKSYKIVDIL